jgi:hypothetical protein
MDDILKGKDPRHSTVDELLKDDWIKKKKRSILKCPIEKYIESFKEK